MKIAVRGGHTERCGGAVALISELTEDRLVKNAVIKYLKELGHTVLDVTPPVNYTSNENTDLVYGVNKANSWKADLFISIHFNNAYKKYTGTLGTEVCVYSKFDDAQRVVNGLANLGFTNRGQKVRGEELYELRETNMKSMIIEVCFVEATKDVELYKKIGSDVIGKNIAESISNRKINTNSSSTQNKPQSPTNKQLYRIRKSWSDVSSQKGAYSDLNNAINECNKYSEYKVYDEKGSQVYPKISSNKPTPKPPTASNSGYKLVPQNGKCTWNTSVQIREKPSTKSKSVGQYNKGQTVVYDYYVDNEGYRWISWIGGSGKRRYSAVRVLYNNKKYGNCV